MHIETFTSLNCVIQHDRSCELQVSMSQSLYCGKKAQLRLLTQVWRQGSCLSCVNLLLPFYKVTDDAGVDNMLVIVGMNRGLAPWSLLVVLLGKRRTNNLGAICSTSALPSL